MTKKIQITLAFLIGIMCIASFLRFFELGKIPNGLNTDETAIGYNAYSILQTGRDEYGVHLPVYFRSFNDYKLPVYIYFTVPAIKLFGVTAFAVRFASALFGTLTIFFLFLLVYLLTKRRDKALIASALLAINPWHIFFSRVGFEVNVAVGLLTIGCVAFFYANIGKRFSLCYFLLAILAFVLSMYCYNITRLLSPLLFISLMLFYYKKLSLEKKVISVIVMMLAIFPLVLSFTNGSGFDSQKGLLISGGESLASMLELRSYLANYPHLFTSLFFNSWMLILWQYVKNIVSFFSLPFFFVSGASQPINGVIGTGMFHLIEVITIPLGIMYGIRMKSKYLIPMYIWMILIILIGCLQKIVPHPTRTYAIIIPFIVFSTEGVFFLVENLWKQKIQAIKIIGVMIFLGSISYSLLYYLVSYTASFPIKYEKEWRAEDEKLVQYLQSNQHLYDKIIVDESADFAYTSLLFYQKYSPASVQKEAVYIDKGLLGSLAKLEKYEFRKLTEQDLQEKNVLVITGSDKKLTATPVAAFTYSTRPVVIYFDKKIGQFPVTDTAYRLFSSSSKTLQE
ncbi:hypothetical protein BH11PAT1_BH11PAT1_4060 [soil metagenome]